MIPTFQIKFRNEFTESTFLLNPSPQWKFLFRSRSFRICFLAMISKALTAQDHCKQELTASKVVGPKLDGPNVSIEWPGSKWPEVSTWFRFYSSVFLPVQLRHWTIQGTLKVSPSDGEDSRCNASSKKQKTLSYVGSVSTERYQQIESSCYFQEQKRSAKANLQSTILGHAQVLLDVSKHARPLWKVNLGTLFLALAAHVCPSLPMFAWW